FICELLAAAFTKDILFVSCFFTFKVTHIFHHADNLVICMLCHCTSSCCNKSSSRVRCCNDDFFTVRQHLVNIQCHITGTRWQVKQQIIQISPLHFFKETCQHLAEHRPSPYNRRIFFNKESHGNDFDTKSLYWDNRF